MQPETTPLAAYFPPAALAAVLVVVAWNMAEKYECATLLRASRGQIASPLARLGGQGAVAVDEHADDGKVWKVALTR